MNPVLPVSKLNTYTIAELNVKIEECQKKVDFYKNRIRNTKSPEAKATYSEKITILNPEILSYQMELINRQHICRVVLQRPPSATQNSRNCTCSKEDRPIHQNFSNSSKR